MDEKKKQYVNLLFDDELMARIDDFRFANRFNSRTEAIRCLIREGLKGSGPAKGTATPRRKA